MPSSQNSHVRGTLSALVNSSAVREYVIGLTATPFRRRHQYRTALKLEYPHFVILEANLSDAEALKLKKELQAYAFTDQKSALFKKYYSNNRGASHRASLGGSTRYAGSAAYCVYVAWK